jgi:hypothetical protein
VLRALLDFHRIVNDQVHELVEATDFALDAHAQLLEEPDLNSAVLLQQLEDEVDGREKHFVAASALASGHGCEGLWLWFGGGGERFGGFGSGGRGCGFGCGVVMCCWIRLGGCARETSFAGRSSPIAKAEGFRALYQFAHLFGLDHSSLPSHQHQVTLLTSQFSLKGPGWNTTDDLKGSGRATRAGSTSSMR